MRQDVFKLLLPVLDNFDRAAQSLRPKTPGEEAVHQAWLQVATDMQQLIRCGRSAGVEWGRGACAGDRG